jgi:hypothetical protein
MPRYRWSWLFLGLVLFLGAPDRGWPAGVAAQAGLDVQTWVSESDWSLAFLPADPKAVAKIRYHLPDGPGDTGWRTADERLVAELGQLTPGHHRIEIEALNAAGASKGPYTLWLDPDEECSASARTTWR